MIKAIITEGDVCIVTDKHLIMLRVVGNEIVVEVVDEATAEYVAEMTLEIPDGD